MTNSNTCNNVFTSVANLPESLDQGINKYGIKPRPATLDQINADKKKIKSWFSKISKPALQLNAYQQLQTGHVYPYAYLPENKYLVALMNRILMNGNDSTDDTTDWEELLFSENKNKAENEKLIINYFKNLQARKYKNLNELVHAAIKNLVDKNKEKNGLGGFINKVLNIPLSETSPYTDLHNEIKKLLKSPEYQELNKHLTAGDIDAIKKLRHDVYAMRDQVDFELRKLKIDIRSLYCC